MKQVRTFFITILVVNFLFGCSNTGQNSGMKNISGRPGELVIVINNEIWKGTVDSVFTDVLAQPQVGLPQPEAIFNLMHIPVVAFSDIFKTSRNLLMVYIGSDVDSSGVFFAKDKYAYPQALVSISAKDKEEMLQLFNSHSDKIIGYFLKAEKDRLAQNYAKFHEKAVLDASRKKFGVSIDVAPGFTVAKERDDFLWARFETPEISQGIFVYTSPYDSDSAFSRTNLEKRRNLVLGKYVPGPSEGSFMTTETSMPLMHTAFKKDGNYAAELRGLWSIANDYMGGPFVSLSMLDLLHNRIVTVEGYVYAPSKDKRNLLRQVEAMVYSFRFDDQKDIDKLNRQFE